MRLRHGSVCVVTSVTLPIGSRYSAWAALHPALKRPTLHIARCNFTGRECMICHEPNAALPRLLAHCERLRRRLRRLALLQHERLAVGLDAEQREGEPDCKTAGREE